MKVDRMVCGIEIKGSDLIFVIIGAEKEVIQTSTKKITLQDSEDSDSLKFFANEFFNLILNYNFERIFIKARPKKGKFAGGPDSFKIEGIVQYLSTCPVVLVSPSDIRKFEKSNPIEILDLNKYQEGAYITAVCGYYKE